jgi:hypothetical protein
MDLPAQANAPDLDQEFVHLEVAGELELGKCNRQLDGAWGLFPLVPDLTWRISEGLVGGDPP